MGHGRLTALAGTFALAIGLSLLGYRFGASVVNHTEFTHRGARP
jgi:hypothetical protein